MIKFKYIESIKGSSKENEDVASFYNNYCWIIDGATDVFETTNKIGFSVSEFVRKVSSELPSVCDDRKSLEDILRSVISKVSLQFLGSLNFSEDFFAKLPTFSFVFCREIDSRFEYLIIGDCYLIYNEKIITDNRISKFSKSNRLKLEKSMLELGTLTEEKRLTIFRNTRLKANKHDGYPIGSMNPNSIKSALKGSISLSKIKRFLIMSDGYFAFYDPLKSSVEISENIIFHHSLDKLYGKKDDASVIEGIFI